MAAPTFDHPSLAILSRGLAPSPLSAALARIAVTVAQWETRARTRAQLRAMDPARLPDVGLTTAEALREAEKPFWVA